MKTHFETFAKGFENAATDWDGLIGVFAEDAVLQYHFAGFPPTIGNRVEANAGFKPFLKRFIPKFHYISGSGQNCIYKAEAYYELTNGKASIYTSHGYLEFNEEGKVTKKTAYSNDSEELASFIIEAMQAA